MFETTSKFPKFFVYVMASLAALICVGMFFSVKIVLAIYFIAMIFCILLLILDKKYSSVLTNYKLTYLLFDLINLIAIVSIVYYEYSNHSDMLNLFLMLLIAIELILIALDIFVIKNKKLTKALNILIDFAKLCSMICILTYFFNVSKLYFAIFAFNFESINMVIKVISIINKNFVVKTEDKEEFIENVIHSEINERGENE